MTTKRKIITGFFAMLVIMVVLAALGYFRLQTASDGFNEYRRLARLNVFISDMISSLANADSDIYQFTASEDSDWLKQARKNLDTLTDLVKQADPQIELEERQAALESVRKNERDLRNEIGSIEADLAEVLKQYRDTVLPMSHKMVSLLNDLTGVTLAESNDDAIKQIVVTMGHLGTARSAASRFAQARDDKNGARALETLGFVGNALKELQPLLATREERALFEELTTAHNSLNGAMVIMVERCKAFQGNMQDIATLVRNTSAALNSLHKDVNTDQNTVGPKTLESNSNGQLNLLGVSVGGIIIGLILAAIAIWGILRVLKELGVFAGAIASGDFNYAVKIHEKGEVGDMVGAMQRIPAALNDVLAEYQKLEKQIENGTLGAEGDPGKFSGDFATLIRGTNAILGRFRTVLENIPSPVVVLDSDLKATYLNTQARNVAGADYKGKTCFQLFARDDFGTDACGLTKAVATKQSASGETVAHPQGKDMDISYTAIPMYNNEGKLASVLQLITDLTAIKQTQRTIMNVANQAAEVSNRVAAAAEELSAQVGQVSRGAEMQRSRVESTASAMTEMNATVLEVARNASQASEQTELTRSKADNGAALVNQVVQSINTVNRVASTMHVNMQELGSQAESIGGVMNVISDIADQTNLLALNAAIEAARAGEAGRGFAVVADEVRKLAEKTMAATNEVGSSISAIQHSARVNIDAVENASKAVAEATELANTSGTALSEIVDLASSNSSIVSSIATAAEEQSATSEEISNAISEINGIVGETTDGMVQASAAVQELSRTAQELNRIMGELK